MKMEAEVYAETSAHMERHYVSYLPLW